VDVLSLHHRYSCRLFNTFRNTFVLQKVLRHRTYFRVQNTCAEFPFQLLETSKVGLNNAAMKTQQLAQPNDRQNLNSYKTQISLTIMQLVISYNTACRQEHQTTVKLLQMTNKAEYALNIMHKGGILSTYPYQSKFMWNAADCKQLS